MASDGQSFLVVAASTSFTVYGRLISSQGVSGRPFFIGTGEIANTFWNGHAYLVVLQDLDYSVLVATIPRRGGGVLSVERVWQDTPRLNLGLSVGWNGRRVILTSNDTSNRDHGGHGRVQILDAEGHPLGKPVSKPFGGDANVPIFGTSDGFIAVDYSFYATHLDRISDDGVVDPNPVVVPSDRGVLLSDGKRNLYIYAVSIWSATGRETTDVYLQPFDAGGAAGPPQFLFTTLSGRYVNPLSAALLGSRLIVGMGEFHGTDNSAMDAFVHVFDIGPNGAPKTVIPPVKLTGKVARENLSLESNLPVPEILCNAETCAFRIGEFPSVVRIIAPAQLGSTLRPDEGEVALDLDNELTKQTHPVIAAGDAGYLTAWNERDGNDHWQLMTSRISAEGLTTGRNGLALPNRETGDPTVVWGTVSGWLPFPIRRFALMPREERSIRSPFRPE